VSTDVHPPLDDHERSLLCHLAVQVVAAQTGEGFDDTAAALDALAAEGQIAIWRDGTDAVLTICDQVIVHAERDWLRFMAHRPADPALN